MTTVTEETTAQDAETVARSYFEALGRRERDAQRQWYSEDAIAHLHGLFGPGTREDVAAYFAGMFDAIPDFRFEILETIAEGDRVAVSWHVTGTFAGQGPFMNLEPNGARLDLRGVDVVQVTDGKISRIDAYTDGTTFARQVGMLPPQGSPAEVRLAGLFNRRSRLARRLIAGQPERVADGVWVIRGGFPAKTMNVYLLEDDGGVTIFDAGIEAMTRAVASSVAGLGIGEVRRVVLGHAHADHRGIAPGLGVPVHCHPADRADAEGDGGWHYFDFSKLDFPARWLMPRMLRWWDGGPVEVEGTVDEGDEVAGFQVVHLPGHAPGLIGLWRESDRLALVSDCFYTLDPQTGKHGHARVPHAAFNHDTEEARASIRKLAALEPAAAWAGHADPVTGDVRAQLERAADTT